MKISKISSIVFIIFSINLLSTKITIAEDVLLPHVDHVDGMKHDGTLTGSVEHIRTHLPQHFEADSDDTVESVDSLPPTTRSSTQCSVSKCGYCFNFCNNYVGDRSKSYNCRNGVSGCMQICLKNQGC